MKQKILIGLLCLAVGLPSLIHLGRYVRLTMVPDTRELAARWIEENLPGRSKVLKTFYTFLPEKKGDLRIDWLDNGPFDDRKRYASSLLPLETYVEEGYRYLVLDEWHVGMIFEGTRGSPKYEIQREKYHRFLGELKERGERIQVFTPYKAASPGRFDVENAEFSAHSLDQLRYRGPRIEIYRFGKTAV